MIKVIFGWATKGQAQLSLIDDLMFWLFIVVIFVIIEAIKSIKEKKK